jgi:hypothetical protein
VALKLNGVAVGGTPQLGGDFSAIPTFVVPFAPGTLAASALSECSTRTNLLLYNHYCTVFVIACTQRPMARPC